MIHVTPDAAAPRAAFDGLPWCLRALLACWVNIVLLPSRRVLDRSPHALANVLEHDTAGRVYVTDLEVAGALVAAGLRLDHRGFPFARPRRRPQPGTWGLGAHQGDADERLAFEALLRAVEGRVRVLPRCPAGVRREVLGLEVLA